VAAGLSTHVVDNDPRHDRLSGTYVALTACVYTCTLTLGGA
jgi:hypothetical protein